MVHNDQPMPRKRDDESGRYTDAYTDADFLDAVRRESGMASTTEVADRVGCTRRTALNRLEGLAEAGQVERRDVGDAALWILGGGDDGE